MGCLNSTGDFKHWFGNIHLSGPCNRACYWCIGQHMMALDSENNLGTFPLVGIEHFVERCLDKSVTEVNLTGTNTDPLLYRHIPALRGYLENKIPGLKLGLRTNGALAISRIEDVKCFDKLSLSVHSLNEKIYRSIMGTGSVPDIQKILELTAPRPLKVNVVLCKENTETGDIWKTIDGLIAMGVKKINLREPYGQPTIGNPIKAPAFDTILGMPRYQLGGCSVVYWDVHYVEVESVNLYANGNVSEDYPITRGHDPTGTVKDQSHFPGGRVQEQWITLRRKPNVSSLHLR